MNQSEASWSRCAKEFAGTVRIPTIIVKLPLKPRESEEAAARPVRAKKLDFKNGFSSCRGVVATDAALAHLDQIETSEFVAKWIADGICTPPTSENCNKADEEDESVQKKSPRIKLLPKRKSRRENGAQPSVERSPIFKKRRRDVVKDCRVDFGLWDKAKLNESAGSSDIDKSPSLGSRILGSGRKHRPKIKRKRLQDQLESGSDALTSSRIRHNVKESSFGSLHAENKAKILEKLTSVPENKIGRTILAKLDTVVSSQDLFDDELITASPQLAGIYSPKKKKDLDLKEKDDKGAGLLVIGSEPSPPPWINDESRSEIKPEGKICDVEKTEGHQSSDVIPDTEDFPRQKSWEKFLGPSQRQTRHLILDSELTPEKKDVPDTERIDYESSSENEGENGASRGPEMNLEADYDSDKTVSDLIEEPTTQDSGRHVEPSRPAAMLSWRSDLISFSPIKSLSSASPKISEPISLHEPNSPQISIVDISKETMPSRSQESPVPAAELFNLVKKKKSRPKKGSLGARLQKLISGQASSVRLWRHQMSRESGFERSSAPSTTLLVIKAWVQYGKNLYRSKVLNDPYDLLNGYFLDGREESKEKGRYLVVMTNPTFVGSVRLWAGSVFKIYLPWEVFNRNSNTGNLVLHSMYFAVVSNPTDVKLEPNDDWNGAEKPSDEITHSRVSREFDCPCLRSGRIDDSCLKKFTDQKVDIIAEIFK